MSARHARHAVALMLASLALPAHATFHLTKIVEIFTGTPAAPQAQYVVIQAYASGENLFSGHAMTVYDATGKQAGSFTFNHNLSNSASQMKVLIATPQAATFFDVTPDMTMSATMMAGGGKVCWAGTIDCVAWGAYTAGTSGVGAPFGAPRGITPGRAALRRLDLSGSATVLDAGDDTNNSASDFVLGTPAPRNNAGMPGRIPGNTCGNGVIEGLEQCDDHNLTDGDGCSRTCAVEPSVVRDPPADFDGDGRSDLFWRNMTFGSDAIWRSANSATGIATAAVTDQRWQVAATGDFDGDGAADVVWRHASSGVDVLWRSGNATTSVPLTAVTNTAWHILGAGDFDGDGRQDLLWRNTSNGANAIWRSANASTPLPVLGVANLDWQIVGIGDVNHDGRSDIVWRNAKTGADTIWLSANGNTPQTMTGVTDLNWRIVGVGDFDGDGASDVVWRNVASGANAIWRSGDAATGMPMTTVTLTEWQIASVGDYDGDGRSDVFWRNATTGANVVWRSANAATPLSVSSVSSSAWKVVPYLGQPQAGAVPVAASLSVVGTAVEEGNSGTHLANFVVQLSKPLPTSVTYDITTADGTAVAGSDYQARSLSGQTIPAGQTSASFAVTIMGDTAIESTETFSVRLTRVVGATIGTGTATGTIEDDDYMYGY